VPPDWANFRIIVGVPVSSATKGLIQAGGYRAHCVSPEVRCGWNFDVITAAVEIQGVNCPRLPAALQYYMSGREQRPRMPVGRNCPVR